MFSGKIPKDMPKTLLHEIYQMYLEKHGHGIRNLEEFRVTVAAHELFAQRIPNLYEHNGQISKPLLVENFQELEARGFLRKGESLWYHLTVQGYDQAAKTRWQSFVDYWNSNPGLNTIVALVSAFIASLSLVVAVIALSSTSTQGPSTAPAEPFRVVSQ